MPLILDRKHPHAPVGLGTCYLHPAHCWIWGHLCPLSSMQPWGSHCWSPAACIHAVPPGRAFCGPRPPPALGHDSGSCMFLEPTPCLSLVPLQGPELLSHLPLAMAVASGEAPAGRIWFLLQAHPATPGSRHPRLPPLPSIPPQPLVRHHGRGKSSFVSQGFHSLPLTPFTAVDTSSKTQFPQMSPLHGRPEDSLWLGAGGGGARSWAAMLTPLPWMTAIRGVNRPQDIPCDRWDFRGPDSTWPACRLSAATGQGGQSPGVPTPCMAATCSFEAWQHMPTPLTVAHGWTSPSLKWAEELTPQTDST